ncbi:MAG: SUF system Fe-S cluster assembly regulator [Gammaproteobacteria bacterium]|nr:SUF system Fe-S cluster assembly regulator [Gammaproteobacteria bacterium]MDH4315514.1 SUF system Fe-S cluster assembly regulator [Gammaproteobacteria bacterium]MDH5214299.1 SUF system Fe-S cluster assembly regulator [Gammaproteobacteria bacterium]MDH5501372.1 SUF system Fe-S cluster assembly regulator [Gammaproteobacteria bacterium]
MLRISKLTDYGTVVLAHLADGRPRVASAAELASATGLGLATVSKLLKSLAKAGLVTSTRGSRGGYRLARDAARISAANVIDALDGPVSITECSASDSHCDYEAFCCVGSAWQRINVAIRNALDDISLEDLLRSNSPVPRFQFAGMPIAVEKPVAHKKV